MYSQRIIPVPFNLVLSPHCDLTERVLQNNCIYSKIIALLKSTTVKLAVELWFSRGEGWEYMTAEHSAMKNCTKVMNELICCFSTHFLLNILKENSVKEGLGNSVQLPYVGIMRPTKPPTFRTPYHES